MKIPLVSNLLRLRARSRLRRIMRGYRQLKSAGQMDKISEIKDELTNTVINQCKQQASQHIWGQGFNNAELIIRQYLLIRVAGIELNRTILYAIGKSGSKVIYPLPAEWQNILKQHGVDVAVFRSSLMWYGYVFFLFNYGVLSFIKGFSKNLLSLVQRKSQEELGRYTYFNTLLKGNLPQEIMNGQSHDIISWYYEKIGRINNIDTLCHSIAGVEAKTIHDRSVIYLPSPIPWLNSYKQLIQFWMWGIVAIFLSFVGFFRGRWWHAVILHEAVLAAQTRFQGPESLAQDYMFHNSNWIYRPLWTYEAEKSGSRILFYFYSTNVESFLKLDGSKSIIYGWQASNWPNILVWDKGQVDFLRNDVGNLSAKISTVGEIWFSASGKRLDNLPAKSVAVFDVQPVRESYYQTLGLDLEYYVPATAKQFLYDIYTVLNANKITLALKRKRKIGNRAHPRYRYFVDDLNGKSHYISLDPGVAASHVIEECFAVISMPYTSTALLAREQGKPSVYYDPFSQCQKEDPAAHGIEILCGKEELKDWLNSIVKTVSY